MTKIKVTILNRDRQILIKEVNPNQEHFTSGKCTYMIVQSCVTLSSFENGLNPTPELFFVKNNPLPINFVALTRYDEEKEEDVEINPNEWIVDRITLEMALRNINQPKNPLFDILKSYLTDPSKIMTVVLAIIILVTAFSDQIARFLGLYLLILVRLVGGF